MVRETSLNAYLDLQEEGTLKERELKVVELLGINVSMTDNEMMAKLGMKDRNELSPARWRLFKKGIVESDGKDKCPITGRRVHFWKLAERKEKQMKLE